MKKLVFFIAFILSFNSFSQEFDIVKSEIFKDNKKHSFLAFSLEDGKGGLITIRNFYGGRKIKGYYIQHFDEDLKLKNEYTYEVKKNRIKSAFVKNGKLHLIEFTKDKTKKTLTYSVLSSNIDDFNFSSKELLNFSKENIKKYFGAIVFPFYINNGINQRDKDHLGEVIMSENNRFFAINFDIKNEDKETHKIFVFNDDLDLVYDKFITNNAEDRFFDYNSVDVDDKDGTVYFLGKSYENDSRQRKKKGKANYHFELTKVNKTDQKTVSFKEPEKFIGSLSLVKKNNQLTCIGFYGDKKEHKYNGIAVFKLDPNSLAIDKKKFNPFSEEFLADKYGNNEAKKKRKSKKGITNIDFRSIEALDNGDLVINAEEFFTTTQSISNGNGGFTTYTVYHFNDIISARINTNAEMLWARNINKAQIGFKNSSFTSITINDTTYSFINCSDKIRKLNGDRIAFGHSSAKKSNLYCIMINNDGKMDFKKLIDDKDSKVFYKVNNGIIPENNNEIIFLGKKKKSSQILKIKIKK